jgi:hypothetical protein
MNVNYKRDNNELVCPWVNYPHLAWSVEWLGMC